MKPKPDGNAAAIDLAAVRSEIAAAHEAMDQRERSLVQPPTPHDRWTKLAGFAGPNLKQAMIAGIVHIEIPHDGLGKPRFALQKDKSMKLEIAIDTLQAMIERCQGNLIAIPETDEVAALQRAIDCLTTAMSKREAEIEKAIRMIREIGGWPDKDIQDVWTFIRATMHCPEDDKQEIERRLGLKDKEQ